ncbi:hypothetical protein ACVILK_004207 [Bradyrhizobium embrapense]
MSKRLLMVGAFAAIYLLWGSTYLAIALGLKTIPPVPADGLSFAWRRCDPDRAERG